MKWTHFSRLRNVLISAEVCETLDRGLQTFMKSYPQKNNIGGGGPPVTRVAFFGDRNYRHILKPIEETRGPLKAATLLSNCFWQQVQKNNTEDSNVRRKIPQTVALSGVSGFCVWFGGATLGSAFLLRHNTVHIHNEIFDRKGGLGFEWRVWLCGLVLM